MSPTWPVRAVRREEVGILSGMLARAFAQDPVHTWMLPEVQRRERVHPRMFAALLRHHLHHGIALATEGMEGAALWEPPRPAWPPRLRAPIALAARMLPVFGSRSLHIARGLAPLGRLRPRQPHWYLAVVGADPQRQGRGIGAALIGFVIERCDREGSAAYLEASRVENVPYYRRFGFDVVDPVEIPDGPTVWPMLRRAGTEDRRQKSEVRMP